MFGSMDARVLARMRYLEAIDARDRVDSTPQARRLRQISPDTGKLLAILAASSPAGECLEIGTSAGYSALWLSMACREGGRRLTTFEVDPAKVHRAEETFREAGVEGSIDLVQGDARQRIADHTSIAFCFLDADKDTYLDCYEKIVPGLVQGGILVADNVISHEQQLAPFLDRALNDRRVDSVVVPIGKGLLVCRKA